MSEEGENDIAQLDPNRQLCVPSLSIYSTLIFLDLARLLKQYVSREVIPVCESLVALSLRFQLEATAFLEHDLPVEYTVGH